MQSEILVKQWFEFWENGLFQDLPFAENFSHTSPYGTISGRKNYLEIVEMNRDKFLGHHFEIHDAIYMEEKACVRYSAIKDDFKLEVSEWHYIKEGLIQEIIAYYNIEGEISDERKLEIPD